MRLLTCVIAAFGNSIFENTSELLLNAKCKSVGFKVPKNSEFCQAVSEGRYNNKCGGFT